MFRKNKSKTNLFLVLTFLFFTLSTAAVNPSYEVHGQEVGDTQEDIDIAAESALVVDIDTGQVLLDQNTDQINEIASLTKMITQYIVFQEIEGGNLSWDDPVEISAYAGELSTQPGLANVPLQEGNSYTVEELFDAMSIYSANAATVALAEHIGGSEPVFVDWMRDLLESWGIDSPQIYNASGLNNSDLLGNHYPGSSEDAENQLSATELSVVAMNLLNDYPQILETSSVPSQVFSPGTPEERVMTNWNLMLEGLAFEREGVTGLKTGTTLRSGANFVGVAAEGDRNLLTVIMNAGDGLENKTQRFVETDRMMDYGFNEWTYNEIVQEGTSPEAVQSVQVHNGQVDSVDLVTDEALSLLLPEEMNQDDLAVDYEMNNEAVDDEGRLAAPIDAAETLGEMNISFNEEIEFIDIDEYADTGETSSTESIQIPLHAEQSVERLGLFPRIGNWFGEILN